jgi:tetratricopeptide (TPR) repeat protein
MRKLINTLAILVGAIALLFAINLYSAINSEESSLLHGIIKELDQNYNNALQEKKIKASSLLIVGILFLIIGLIGYFKSGRKNEKKQAANEIMKLQTEASKRFNKREFEEASVLFKRLITIDPDEGIHHFNLACCYSQLQNPGALKQIELAVSKGYTNFDKIKTYEYLNWIRKQENFDAFIQRGKKIFKHFGQRGYSMEALETKKNNFSDSEDPIKKLEKLIAIKDKGLLTPEEFNDLKKKILDN